MGPVGVGAGEVARVALGALARVALAVEASRVCEYMLSRLGPPQYSVMFPAHVMSHIVAATVRPVARTDPLLILFPQ